MQADWTKTATALPPEGTLVEFLLDARNCPMRGIYAIGRFESRWNDYPPPSVNRWRSLGTESARANGSATRIQQLRRRVAGEAASGAIAVGAA
jgi:hypothetical protein